MSTNILKLQAAADILGGTVFFTDNEGKDPEFPDSEGLIANSLYIRLEGSDGSIAYIAAYEINNALNSINNTLLTKANKSELTTLQQTINNKIESDLADITSRFEQLNSSIAKYLTEDDIASLRYKLNELTHISEDLNAAINNAKIELGKKIDLTSFENKIAAYESRLTNMDNSMLSKATKAEVNAKANKSDVQTLTTKINALENTVSNFDVIDTDFKDIKANFEDKADKTTVNTELSSIKETLNKKVNSTELNRVVSSINSQLLNITTKHNNDVIELSKDIDELECELNNAINTQNVVLNNQTKKIELNSNNIAELQTKTNAHTEQLRHPWVRVLTTIEYKNLIPAREGMSYSPYYRFPNILYFVVDFNKPKALYIGDIQIAKAEKRGSVGFSYTFPISF